MGLEEVKNNLNYEKENSLAERNYFINQALKNNGYYRHRGNPVDWANPFTYNELPDKYKELYENNAEAMHLINAVYNIAERKLTHPASHDYIPWDIGFWGPALAKNYLDKKGYSDELYKRLDVIDKNRRNQTVPFYKDMINSMFYR